MYLREEPLFDGPIPGQGLTAELGSRPWQNPPQLSTVEEAIDYYVERLTDESAIDQIVDILEMGVPIADIANAVQLGMVMDGVHSVDVGILVIPIIIELMMYIGDQANVQYETGLDKTAKDGISDAKIVNITSKLKQKIEEKDSLPKTKEEKPEVEEKEEDKSVGLMSRRKV
mgnify:CR=1 FL=1|tara:strand:+ start:18 stop:533 length:516 start_codon:yes stop_codon:yes gene_type:complete